MFSLRTSATTFLFLLLLSLAYSVLVCNENEELCFNGNKEQDTYEFLGIPFAKSPVGDLRFAPPVPWLPPSSPHEVDATTEKSACMQENLPNFFPFPGEPNEDCLYLNIYTPISLDLKSQQLPVMVWIHGGSFVSGSATENKYNGSVLASTHEVVVVTINYRLGAFGFMAQEDFCDEDPSCGLYGILDQQMALSWIEGNIQSFGGNSHNITLFGESAGAMSIGIHLALESSANLFHKAIMESGMAEGYPSLQASLLVGESVTSALNCNYFEDSAKSVECMRSLSAADILATSGSSWLPVVNGNELNDQPLAAMESGGYNQVPVILGCNGNEGFIFAVGLYPPPITPAEYERIIIAEFGEFAAVVMETYPLSDYDSPFAAIDAIIGDFLFVCPTQFMVEAFNNPNTNNPRSYLYLFDHTPSWVAPYFGSYHGAELNFVFGYRPEDESGLFTPDENILSANMTQLWTDFAKHGNPNSFSEPNSPFWPRYTNTLHQRLVLTTETPYFLKEYKQNECTMWSDYFQFYYPNKGAEGLIKRLLSFKTK